MNSSPSAHAQVVVDLGAIRYNVTRLRELVSEGAEPGAGPAVMVVVKADAYGHGMIQVARAARAAGAEWLGVATGAEALSLRVAGDTGRILCWLAAPDADYTGLVATGVDITAYSVSQLEEILDAAQATGVVARVQLKIDTGLSRGGATSAQWPALVEAARAAEEDGSLVVTGVWSHLACSDDPDHPANAAQLAAFDDALAVCEKVGLDPRLRHLANSAGALFGPSTRYDLVRLGIAVYGLSPAPDISTAHELGLVPAMTVRGSVVLTKQLDTGDGVSYGHRFVAPEPMQVALVPMGYGDGVPRAASSTAEVWIGGRRRSVLGTICMDQFVVEGADVEPGDDVVLLGPGTEGEPTATDWARWCGTINYEIVTRMGGRHDRIWIGEA